MKTINELRKAFTLHPNEISSSIRYFKSLNIDWNVYLKTKGKNLQRDFVWDIEQKRELINSIIIGRHIPHCAVINSIVGKQDIYLIIDGKQRLSSIFDFIDNKYTIIIDGKEYLFSELPSDYQIVISKYNFRYYIVNEENENDITDDDKITWFKFINYAGTIQDKNHLDSLI